MHQMANATTNRPTLMGRHFCCRSQLFSWTSRSRCNLTFGQGNTGQATCRCTRAAVIMLPCVYVVWCSHTLLERVWLRQTSVYVRVCTVITCVPHRLVSLFRLKSLHVVSEPLHHLLCERRKRRHRKGGLREKK